MSLFFTVEDKGFTVGRIEPLFLNEKSKTYLNDRPNDGKLEFGYGGKMYS